jgi:Spy/CpxP family protein refolding chaperone
MKNLRFVLVALMMVSVVAFAQQKQQPLKKQAPKQEQKQQVKKATPEQRATRQTETLANKLVLTAEQKASVNKAILDKINTLDQIKAKYQGNKSKERNTELKNTRIAFEQEMKTILTPEQYDKWYKAREARRSNKSNKNKKVKTAEPEETENIF